ncbi:hypothetical protein CRYUN_Cryun10bG0058400 [Craigia yunnanensis]
MWTNITKPLCTQENQVSTFSSGSGYCIGDGHNIRFWCDEWIEGVVLKLVFPMIFALLVNKEGKVRDFGRWINKSWSWNIVLRRSLFGWELHLSSKICVILKGFVVCDNLKDSFIWKGSSSGRYSASLYCKSILNS